MIVALITKWSTWISRHEEDRNKRSETNIRVFSIVTKVILNSTSRKVIRFKASYTDITFDEISKDVDLTLILILIHHVLVNMLEYWDTLMELNILFLPFIHIILRSINWV